MPIYAVLFDAYETLFAPSTHQLPLREQLRLRLAQDGVAVTPGAAEQAIAQEVKLYRQRFPHVRGIAELTELQYAAADLVLHQLGNPPVSRERMREHLLAIFEFVVYPDVKPVLPQLRAAGKRLGVVSNFNDTLDYHLERLDLRRWFDVVVSSAQVGATKPSPIIFLAAVERLGAQPSTVVFVGDSLTDDVYGAQACGLRGVWLNRNRTAVPEGVTAISSLTELPSLLANLG
jgi:2-haloalkanoic acid dehalogenase type II